MVFVIKRGAAAISRLDSSPDGCLAENLGVLLEAGPCLLLLMNSALTQRTYLDSIPKI